MEPTIPKMRDSHLRVDGTIIRKKSFRISKVLVILHRFYFLMSLNLSISYVKFYTTAI